MLQWLSEIAWFTFLMNENGMKSVLNVVPLDI